MMIRRLIVMLINMIFNPKSGYDTYTVRIDNDWTYVHDITSDIF